MTPDHHDNPPRHNDIHNDTCHSGYTYQDLAEEIGVSVRTVQRLCQRLEVSGCLSDRSDGGKVRLFSEEEREKLLAHRDITSHRDTTNVAMSDRPYAIAAIAEEVAQRLADTAATTTTNIVAMALTDRLGELRRNQENTAHVLETLREGLQQLLTMNEALRTELDEERTRTHQRELRYQEASEQARVQEQNLRTELQSAREEAKNRETQLVEKLVEFQQAWQQERQQAQQREQHLLSEIEQTRADSQQREQVFAEQLEAIQAESQQHALEIKQREEELAAKIENHFKDAKRPWWQRIWPTRIEPTANRPENTEKDSKQS